MPRTQAVSTAQVGAAPFFAGKNKIINGAFDIWQRGTSFAAASGAPYTADRFYTSGVTANGTFSRQTASLDGFQYCMRVQRNSGSTSTSVFGISQSLESVNSIPFQNKTLTLSFWARAGADLTQNLGVRLYTGTGTDEKRVMGGASYTGETTRISETVTLTTSWQRLSYVTSSAIGSSDTEISIGFFFTGSGTAGAANYFEITGVQLEAGSVATAFQTATGTIQGELAACQRYYVLLGNTLNQPMAIGYNYSGTLAIFGIHLPVEMRTNPTISSTTGTNYYGFVRNGGTDNFNSFTLDVVGNKFINVYNSTEISGTAGNAGTLVISNSSGFLAAQAEL